MGLSSVGTDEVGLWWFRGWKEIPVSLCIFPQGLLGLFPGCTQLIPLI
uniref:Uncharacterized protein n=1 Tax=Anguilla anguilla TaxID=7936 RepID=A0A0E9WJL3_ANGAN